MCAGADDGEHPSPIGVLENSPLEDAGSKTAQYYEFQYGCATAVCFEMASETSRLSWVLCEWHTDFILGWMDGGCALVSVKHREPNSGRWTIALLFSDGGLLTLFQRWMDCGRPQECRWMTNGGLDGACTSLQKACAGGDLVVIGTHAAELCWRFKGRKLDEVAAFLGALRLDNDAARAVDQRCVDIEQIARPTLRSMGLSPSDAPKAYDTVVDLVRKASQSLGTRPAPWMKSESGALNADQLLIEEVRKRLLNRSDIEAALREVGAPVSAELPGSSLPTTTTLAKKLNRGRIIPTAVAAARRGRVRWAAFEMARAAPMPVGNHQSEFDLLRAKVTSVAADAQLEAHAESEPYGNLMLTRVRHRMGVLASEMSAPEGLDAELLMGLVYDLTARCEIWWSPWFDTDATPDAKDG